VSTLIRLPDQFTPGGVAVETAATPTCCCCCCCVITLTATATALPVGLHSDLSNADQEKRWWASWAMVVSLLLIGAPVALGLAFDDGAFGNFIGHHIFLAQLAAFVAAVAWSTLVATWAGATNPWLGAARLMTGAAFFVIEFLLAVFTSFVLEEVGALLIPAVIAAVTWYYSRQGIKS
jgi:hypothetical protein